MRVGKFLLICGVVAGVVVAYMHLTEAQLNRRSSVLQSRTRRTTANSRRAETQNVVATIFALSPTFSPANGPEGARGVAYMYYDDEVTVLNSGKIVVNGLAEGVYTVWLVFGESPTAPDVFSVPVATFTAPQNGERTEVDLTFNFVEGINVGFAKQLVVTSLVSDVPELGTEPVAGAAGYPEGPGAGTAVLAGYLTENGNPEPGSNADSEPSIDSGEQDAARPRPMRQGIRSPLLRNQY